MTSNNCLFSLSQILYDFAARFGENNANGIILNWPIVQKNLLLHTKRKETELCLNKFDDSIGYFLILLMALGVRKNFEENVKKFIVFIDVCRSNALY